MDYQENKYEDTDSYQLQGILSLNFSASKDEDHYLDFINKNPNTIENSFIKVGKALDQALRDFQKKYNLVKEE